MSKMKLTRATGDDLYGRIENATGLVYNGSTFEVFDVDNLSYYGYDMTDNENGTYTSIDDFPALTAATYYVKYYERLESSEYNENDLEVQIVETVWSGLIITDEDTNFVILNSYATVQEGNEFFNNRLNILKWTSATILDKARSLNMATAAINKLNFAGTMTDEDQTHQFPRDDDTNYPQAIKDAVCLCAYKFLDGWEVDVVREEARIDFQAYGPVKQSYKDGTLPYLMAGIPSSEAWDLLMPFLRQQGLIKLDRIS